MNKYDNYSDQIDSNAEEKLNSNSNFKGKFLSPLVTIILENVQIFAKLTTMKSSCSNLIEDINGSSKFSSSLDKLLSKLKKEINARLELWIENTKSIIE